MTMNDDEDHTFQDFSFAFFIFEDLHFYTCKGFHIHLCVHMLYRNSLSLVLGGNALYSPFPELGAFEAPHATSVDTREAIYS